FSVDPATGQLPLTFGPLVNQGGERRLNVAITRARKQVLLFSSFDPAHIDLARTTSQGLADLRAYLEFAVGLSSVEQAPPPRSANRGRFTEALADQLCAAGYECELDVGHSSFRVDLAVRMPGDDRWRLAVLVDGPGWASRPTVADRDGAPVLLPAVMHWPAMMRVWLPQWIRDPAGVVTRVGDAVRAAGPQTSTEGTG
ncbi:MAG: hypothetical protein FWE61_07225, partial [Micrococcales bacterium]|nr:hypothetical protein [Micrococcales bacterium]